MTLKQSASRPGATTVARTAAGTDHATRQYDGYCCFCHGTSASYLRP